MNKIWFLIGIIVVLFVGAYFLEKLLNEERS